MLERLQTIAKLFSRLKALLLIMAVAGASGFGLSVFESPLVADYQLMMPSLVIMFWAVTGLCFSALFENIPPPADSKSSFRQRWITSVKRGGYWLLGSFMVLLSLSLLLLSYQLIRAWSML